MHGRERILVPITLILACYRVGAQYRDHATNCQVLLEGQVYAAEEFA
jgi:hypothetical protein